MTMVEREPTLAARDQRVYGGMRVWASSHLKDLIGILDYDPTNPDQFAERVLLEAKPNLEEARLFGSFGMGFDSYKKLNDDFQKIDIVGVATENARASRPTSTLVATLHTKDTLDTAMTHNAAFSVSNGDPGFAEMNVVLANFIMSAMTIGGYAVDRVLTKSGREIRVLPDKALKYISQEDFDFINRLALPAFNRLLKQGVLLHQAPSAQRALKAEKVATGEKVLVVPTVQDGTVHTIIKKSPNVIGVPMDVKPGDTKATVLEPRRITNGKELHSLMNEMVEEVNVFSDKLVVYGTRKGIRVLENQRTFDAS